MSGPKKQSTVTESVLLQTFLSWDYHEVVAYEYDTEIKIISKLECKVIMLTAFSGNPERITGQSLLLLMNYVYGVGYVHKSNIARHVESGLLHDWAK